MSETESAKRNRLRLSLTLAACFAVLAGAAIVVLAWPPPGSQSAIARYIFGDRSKISALVVRVRAGLATDVWFIAGYGLVLGGFAAIFLLWAISAFGRLSAKYVAMAVAITVAADAASHALINCAMCHQDSTGWIAAASVAATIKWCASLLTLGGILATAGIFLRAVPATWRWLRDRVPVLAAKYWWLRVLFCVLTAPWLLLRALFCVLTVPWWLLRRGVVALAARWQWLQILFYVLWAKYRWLRDCLCDRNAPRVPRKTSATWWTRVQVPLPTPDDPQGKEEPAAPAEPADTDRASASSRTESKNQLSWVNAYNVPDAMGVRDDRERDQVQAICLSGGGVRSACIAMGVLQEFSKAPPIKLSEKIRNKRFGDRKVEPKLIDSVDYVISVSGGGYTAGARLLAVQVPENPLLSERFEEGSPEFDHFRSNSSYIADSPGELFLALIVVLKNLIGSMAILFTLPAALGSVFGYLLSRPFFSFAEIVPVPPDKKLNAAFMAIHANDYLLCLTAHSASRWAAAVFAGLAVFFSSAAMLVEFVSWRKLSEWLKLRLQGLALGSVVFMLLVLAVVVGLPALMRLCWKLGEHTPGNQGGAAVAVSGLVGLNYLAAIAAMAWKDRSILAKGATKLSSLKRLMPPGVVALILVMLTLAGLLVAWLLTLGCFAAGVFHDVTATGVENTVRQIKFSSWGLLALLLLTLLWFSSVDIASLSLNPFYRTRLGQTFAVRRVKHSDHWRAEAYDPNEYTWLTTRGHVPAGGPEFVFAAAATITGRDKPAPGLNAVSYVLSRDYIGGPDLGWMRTKELFEESPPRIKRDLTVLTAVAVSGAAFASAMGRYQRGFEKLLAISGARLGTWLPNPKFITNLAAAQKDACFDPKDNTRPWPRSLPYVRGAGYYYRELLGLNNSDARLVQITDGGHYENLGLVEALRRRSRLIFCVDGGGDRPPLASGLGDALRLAEYELGVTITFDRFTRYPLSDLTPGSGKPFEKEDAFYSLNSRLAKRTVAVGHITYPEASGLADKQERRGLLIFAKAVLTRECPQWLLTYAASSEIFPHDPTSDQWFNEGQFAAYTELGRIMGVQAVECANNVRAR